MKPETKSEIKQLILENIFELNKNLNELHQKCNLIISDEKYCDYVKAKKLKLNLKEFNKGEIKFFKTYDKQLSEYFNLISLSYIELKSNDNFRPHIIMKRYAIILKDIIKLLILLCLDSY